jgi:protein-tyrosine-phosphatase
MVRDADLVVTMGAKHKETVRVIEPEAASYTVLLTDFCDVDGDVPDPIGGGLEEYERICALIERCIDGMADRLEDFDGWKT